MTTETAATAAGGNYARYWSAPFNRPEHYPVGLTPDPARYQPIGTWLGRLILPTVQHIWARIGSRTKSVSQPLI